MQLMMAPSPDAFMQLGVDFAAMAEAEPAAALDLAVALSVLGFTGPALQIFGDALDNVDAWRAGALETARPHIGYETALLFINETIQLRMNPDFAKLCVRLGLARYWRDTDQWPDCAAKCRMTSKPRAASIFVLVLTVAFFTPAIVACGVVIVPRRRQQRVHARLRQQRRPAPSSTSPRLRSFRERLRRITLRLLYERVPAMSRSHRTHRPTPRPLASIHSR
jgi:hypothetical protein